MGISQRLEVFGVRDDFFLRKQKSLDPEGGFKGEQVRGGHEAESGASESVGVPPPPPQQQRFATQWHTAVPQQRATPAAAPLRSTHLPLPRLLGQGQLGRTRPRGHN